MKAEDILPDDQNEVDINGVAVRKGSVGAFLANAKVWCDPTADSARRTCAEKDMIDALPALRALGLFEAFAVRDAALQRLVDTH